MDSLSRSALAQGFLLLVDSLTRREQSEPRVFDLIEELFAALEKVEPPAVGDGRGPLFDAAAIKLLDIAGFGPELDRCVHCRRELGDSAAMNFFRGGLECRDCRQADSLPVLPETRERLRRLRQQPLVESAVEKPPHHHVGRLVEALLAGHADEHFSTLNFLRRVVA
jgi:recombinational DNA repair protein (RecF pathway)